MITYWVLLLELTAVESVMEMAQRVPLTQACIPRNTEDMVSKIFMLKMDN